MSDISGTEKRHALQQIASEADLGLVEALLDIAESCSHGKLACGPCTSVQETAGPQQSQSVAPRDVQLTLAGAFAQQLAASLEHFDGMGRCPVSTLEKRDISMMAMLDDSAATPECEATVHVAPTMPPKYSAEVFRTAAKVAADVAAMAVSFYSYGMHGALRDMREMSEQLHQHAAGIFKEIGETKPSAETQTDENMKSDGKPVHVRIEHALSGAPVAEIHARSGDSGMELRRQLSAQLQDPDLLRAKFLHCGQVLPLGAPLWMALPDDDTIELLDLQMALLSGHTFERTTRTDHDSVVKVVMVGDAGVGKSCLMHRFVEDTYSDSYVSTIGVDYKNDSLQSCDDRIVRLQVWDTAGQERFRAITSSYYRGCNGALIVFDITDRETFSSLDRWHREVCESSATYPGLVIVGTKADKEAERQVSKEEALSWARKHGLQYVETSSKQDSEVKSAFHVLLSRYLQ